MRSSYLLCCFVMACGAPQERSTSTSPPLPAKRDLQGAAAIPTVPVGTNAPTPAPETGLVLEASPIEILNARFYDGYVLGGLPGTEELDAAMEAGYESALSLMTNDEEGGAELARYGASKGLRYLRFVIAGEEDLNESMAWQFAATEAMLGRPAIIHCASGQRVAAIFALKAYFVDEMSAQAAFSLGKALGMGDFTEHVRKLLELSSP